MKELLRQLIAEAPDPWRARSAVREYAQARILEFLQEKGASRSWIFHGGTALRFLFLLPRFSEDLDFAVGGSSSGPDFASLIAGVQRGFEAEAYQVSIKVDDRRMIHSAFIRFPGLYHELGLSPHPRESLSIKVELDTNPPSGGKTETTVFRRFVVLNFRHYDRASLLSGKLHAVLCRPYVKGRDLYDLLWYLSDRSWPEPNMEFLSNSLAQTHWQGPKISAANWPRLVSERLQKIDWKKAVDDVRPFIEKTTDLELLTRENVLNLLSTRGRKK